jgi:hypothetical protein
MLVKSNATHSYATLYDFLNISLRSFKMIPTPSASDPRADASCPITATGISSLA